MKKFLISTFLLLFFLHPTLILAQSTPASNPTPTLTQEQKEEEKNNERIAREKDRARSDINRRIIDLNSLINKVSANPDLTQNQKNSLADSIRIEIENLSELGTKIQNEDDLETIKEDRREINRIYSQTSTNVRKITNILENANETILESIQLEEVLARVQVATIQTSNRDQDTSGLQSSIIVTQRKINDAVSKIDEAIDIALSLPLQDEDNQSLDTARQLIREADRTIHDAERDIRSITNDLIGLLRDYLRIP
jgi:hypothetical protein